jgi:hypothetical protein
MTASDTATGQADLRIRRTQATGQPTQEGVADS